MGGGGGRREQRGGGGAYHTRLVCTESVCARGMGAVAHICSVLQHAPDERKGVALTPHGPQQVHPEELSPLGASVVNFFEASPRGQLQGHLLGGAAPIAIAIVLVDYCEKGIHLGG